MLRFLYTSHNEGFEACDETAKKCGLGIKRFVTHQLRGKLAPAGVKNWGGGKETASLPGWNLL